MKEVKQGYKETEVGVIPEDWEVKKLGDVGEIVGGGTPSSFNSEYWNGKINWFTPTEIGFRKYVSSSKRKISESGLKNSSARILPPSSLLLTSRATIGEVAINIQESTTNQGFQSIIPSKNILIEYLYYKVLTLKNSFMERASGSTFFEISPKQVKSVLIPLPPTLAEQEKIATALSDTDSYIEKLEKLIEKKKFIKTGAMQELLTGKKRLPGFGKGKGYKETEVGVIPEDWEVKKLGDVGEIVGGGTPSSFNSEYWNGKINWFTPTEIGFRKYVSSSKRKISESGLKNSSARILPPSSLLLTSRATIGEVAINIQESTTNQGFQSIIPSKNILIEYLYYKVLTLKNSFMERASGSTFFEISPKQVKSVLIPLPPTLAEQEKIAEVLSDMDSEIEKLEGKLDKYKNIKQGMMQKLLTGAVRLV
jgi:type I restriction enzyme S subunit